MPVSSSRNLTTALQQIEAAYSDSTQQRAALTKSALPWRAAHFAAAARFSVEQPDVMRRLHRTTARLPETSSTRALLPEVLAGALSLTAADFGNLQLVDPETGALRIVTEYGFDADFLDYFAIVDDDSSACGRAVQGDQTVLPDINQDPAFAVHRDIAASTGFRAVQSTPLIDYAGRLVGVVSTHFRHPHALSGPELRIMRLYADFAGEAIAVSLGAHDGDNHTDLIGTAVVAALLNPGCVGSPDLPISDLPVETQSAAVPPIISADFAGDLMNRVSAVALNLAGAHNLIHNHVARTRVEMAVDQLDRTIREIQRRALCSRRTPDNPDRDRYSAALT